MNRFYMFTSNASVSVMIIVDEDYVHIYIIVAIIPKSADSSMNGGRR